MRKKIEGARWTQTPALEGGRLQALILASCSREEEAGARTDQMDAGATSAQPGASSSLEQRTVSVTWYQSFCLRAPGCPCGIQAESDDSKGRSPNGVEKWAF